MATTLKQVLRIATLVLGMAATSVALAVATVDVNITGPQTTANETTIQLFGPGPDGTEKKPDAGNASLYSNVTEGEYRVDVFVRGTKVGSTTVDLHAGPNKLTVDPIKGQVAVFYPQPPGVPFPAVQIRSLGGSVGPNLVTDKPPTIGDIETTPTQISSMLTGPSRVTTIGERLFVNFLSGSELGLGYQQGDRSTSTEVPTGTKAGYAFWMPTTTGVTGVTSSLGWNSNFKTTYSAFNLDVGLPSWPKKDPSSSYWGVPVLGYQYSEIKYDGTISNATVPGVSSTTNQKVKENDLRGGYGVRGMYTASNQIWVSGGVGLDAIYYWGRYNGTQDNVCPVCSPAAQNYSVSTNDSKSGLTFGAWADAAVGFPVSKDVDLFVQGTYRYDHAVATLVNNVAPTDQGPHLITRDRNWAGIEFGVRVKFNAP